ncbi:uncharacterized protein PAC_00536 [Phialocephala subalpina]|uniref:BZIP domain-containing protein n=1 Tax=Phialocephala subalpina TaxID=576137 RepID=A0A1L7WD03_9HELO|nr:uncharacterized protein PAC_00536 [Phialocephala subalpina]
MTSSVLSSPSIRDSTFRDDDPPPKKRTRGRPLKDAGQSSVPEERRKQVRKAQEAFRQRKQAAAKSLEKRAEALEDCVEEISKVFLSFSDSMLKSQMIQSNPEIGRSLLSTTSRIVDLARSAVAGDLGSLGDDRRPSSSSSGGERENEDLEFKQPSFSPPGQPFPTFEQFHTGTPRLSPLANLFGNGWFDFEPACLAAAPKDEDLSIPAGGFGLKLIQANLQVAYFSLLDDTGVYIPLVTQMYRYAFLYHTREEILSNLRWFLEQGISAQRYLGRAVFGFDATLSLQHLNHVYGGFKPKVLHPLVDAQALLESEYNRLVSPFLNAFDVEEYLVTKGAYQIEEDVIYMRIKKEEKEPDLLTDSNALSITRALPNQAAKPKEKQHCEVFDFNALLKDANNQSIMREVHDHKGQRSSCEQEQVTRLSVPLLLDNLIRNSLCLGTGPGYPRNTIDMAIESSLLPPALAC